MTEEEIRNKMDEYRKKQEICKHRWEESDFGKKWWTPGTWQYQCQRCGKTSMITLGVDRA